MAGAPAAVGDDGGGALHHRFPVRVGHVGDQHVAGLHTVHFLDVGDDAHRAGADALTDGAAFHQHLAGLLEQVALHHGGVGTALHGLRTGLDDVELAVVAVQRPFDVHGHAVVLFDLDGLAGKVFHLGIGEAEAQPVGAVHVHGLHRFAGAGFAAVDHFLHFAAQVAAQNAGALVQQRLFMDIKLIRVHGALHHHFAQAVGGGDEHHVAEAGFGVQGEHDPGGAGLGAHHLLHAGGQGHQFVVEALVHPVADGAVVEQGGEHFLHRHHHMVEAANVEEGFLLTGEGGVRQVFGGGGRAHRHRQFAVAAAHLLIGVADRRFQLRLEGGVHHPFTDLLTGFRQSHHVFHVQRPERLIDLGGQIVVLEEVAESFRGGRKTARDGHAGRRQVADHLAKGGVLATDALDIALAQILKPDYVFRQGRLLKYCWPGEPPTHSWRALALRFRSPGGVSRLS